MTHVSSRLQIRMEPGQGAENVLHLQIVMIGP